MASGLTAIVDYGICNIDSIARALEDLGASVEKTRDPRTVERASRIVLPGVGAYGAAMANLRKWGLDQAIQARVAQADVPFLGICLGMQLMASSGDEYGTHGGLDLVPGKVVRLVAQNADERIPHIGWNEVVAAADCPLFEGVAPASDFYFVHSYHFETATPAVQMARTPYCGGFVSAVGVTGRPIFGTQFHPEKSQRNGQRLLRNFLAM
jgi:glutamine amidotransferase